MRHWVRTAQRLAIHAASHTDPDSFAHGVVIGLVVLATGILQYQDRRGPAVLYLLIPTRAQTTGVPDT